jgi:hypothetical protein
MERIITFRLISNDGSYRLISFRLKGSSLNVLTLVLMCVMKLTITFPTSVNVPKNEIYTKKSELLNVYLMFKMTGYQIYHKNL